MAKAKMKMKKLLILTCIFGLLLLYFLVFESKFQEKKISKNNLFQFVIADVLKFEIIKKDKNILIERLLNNWRIQKPNELPASKTDIDAYLSDVKCLQKLKVIGKDLSNLSDYGLDNPKITLKVYLKNKIHTFIIGNQNPDKSGYYTKFIDSNEILLLEPLVESTIDKEMFYFRDKDIFKIDSDNINTISFIDNNQTYTFSNKNNIWVMISPVQYAGNEVEVKKIINSIIDINIKRFFDIDKKILISDAGLLSVGKQIKIIDSKNQTIILNIGKENKDTSEYYAKLNNKKLIFGIDKFIIDGIVKDSNNLIEEKIKKDEEIKRKAEERKEAVEKKANKEGKNEE